MSCSCQIDAVAGREACRRWFATRPATTVIRWRLLRAIALSAVLGVTTLVARAANDKDGAGLPDAPQAQPASTSKTPEPTPCDSKRGAVAFAWGAAESIRSDDPTAAAAAAAIGKTLPQPVPTGFDQAQCYVIFPVIGNLALVKKLPLINWYARFLDGPQVKPMTPKEKAWLAIRNVADPFNGVTILGSSAIAVASDSHSAYGPGMWGFARYVGVSYSQDLTGEVFGTFLIPSVAHQDPHYHRMPGASIKRRIAHVLYQIAWTQGDNGKGMLNYADLVGFGIDDEIGNLYVPGRETNARSSAERYGTALATAPIDNAVTEFLPDIARRIHIRIVLIQQIINQVANTKDNGFNGQ
jgi:hypothetical protein